MTGKLPSSSPSEADKRFERLSESKSTGLESRDEGGWVAELEERDDIAVLLKALKRWSLRGSGRESRTPLDENYV